MSKAIRTFIQWMRSKTEYYDYNLLAVVILLTCFGLVMLYSTSAYEASTKFDNDMYYFQKQALISVAAILIAVFLSRFDYHLLIPLAGWIYMLSIALMMMVKFTPFGSTVNGARRWFKIGGFSFQPSEISKIAIITFLPIVIIKMGKYIKSRNSIFMFIIIGGLQAGGAYILTENLSTGIIIAGITIVMVFVAHPSTKPFLITGGVLGGLGLFTIAMLKLFVGSTATSSSFRIQRVLVWLYPEENISDGGYQVMQAIYAIGSGGFFGKGLGNSVQKLGPIPEAQNDMIFSVVCEELGVFGGVLLLLLFGYLLYRLLFIAQNAPDLYGSLMVVGIFGHIALQVILNICVVINIIPTTGITLPFVSYGGTSVLFLMMEMGIALSVSRQIKFSDENQQ